MLAILAAALLAAAPPQDTVFTSDGGRVVGTVVEEGPQGVSIKLPDGSFRRFAPRQVLRIEYADGTVSKPAEKAPPPATAAPSPPPAYTPPPPQSTPPPPPRYAPPPPPPYPPPYAGRPPPPYLQARGGPPISPIYLSLGLGGAFFVGDAERDVDVRRVFRNEFAFAFEGGVRITPHLAIALYGDHGIGSPGSDIQDQCDVGGFDCTAATDRFGALLRATFQPAAPVTPWLAIGGGYEWSTIDVVGAPNVSYEGWEIVRLTGGVDFRSNRTLGVGFYAGVRVGRYDRAEDVNGAVHLDGNRATHATIEGGVRFTLFP